MAQRGKNFFAGLWEKIRSFQFFDAARLDEDRKKSLNYMIISVMFGQVMVFITTGAPWTGFLREVLRADDVALGLIAAIPVAANTIQLLAAYLLQRYQNRRFFVIFFGLIGRFFWLPIALTPYFIPAGAEGMRIQLVMVFVVMMSIGNSFLNIGFSSLLADLVPMRIRGNYLSARHGASLLAGILGSLAASFVVDRMGQAGYSVVLAVAGLFGMMDIACFFRVKFPAMRVPPESNRESFLSMMLLVLRDKRFMRVVLCFTGWAFAVNLASPFFNVFMLENLNMSYTRITLFSQIAQNICSVLFVRRWGRPLDRYGSKAVVQIAGRACMVLPLLWLFVTPGNQWLILVISVLTGAFWPAVDLGQQNSYLAASEEHHRAMYMAVFFAVYNLLGVSVGNALGGVLVQDVFTPLAARGFALFGNVWTKYHYIFLLSCILRIAVVIGLFPILREEEGAPYKQALTIMVEEGRARMLRRHIAWQRNHLRRKARAQEEIQRVEQEEDQRPPEHEGGEQNGKDDSQP